MRVLETQLKAIIVINYQLLQQQNDHSSSMCFAFHQTLKLGWVMLLPLGWTVVCGKVTVPVEGLV